MGTIVDMQYRYLPARRVGQMLTNLRRDACAPESAIAPVAL
jgi:hypothetical protein